MITQFLTFLQKNKNYSANTLRAYEKDLRGCAAWMRENLPGARWSTIAHNDIDAWVAALVDDGLAPASVSRHVSSLRSFYNYLLGRGLVTSNPARFTSSPKVPRRLPYLVELSAINNALGSNSVSLTTKVQIALFAETGIRLQECLDLTTADIDRTARSLRIAGKGAKQRTVFYGNTTDRLFDLFIPADYVGRLFVQTQREVRFYIYNALRPYSKASQLSPHALRHTYACEMLNNGADIKVLSTLLGHESVQTTEIYAQVCDLRRAATYQSCAPSLAPAATPLPLAFAS